ncbi:hypothetical protein BDC45DRAFT_542044 [Circinella umbellata]|nr:hypothetical protein BDC45DRAFT_542044 [Circinella umbellata]
MFNVKLVDLLEQLDQTEQPGSSNQVTNLPNVLIDHPTKESYDKSNQKHVTRQQSKVNLPPLESAQKESHFEHVQGIAPEVIVRYVKWKVGKDLYQYKMYRQLERDAGPYLPLKASKVEMEIGLMDDYIKHNLSVYITQENGAVETRNKHNKEGESESNNDNGNTSDSDSYSISDNKNETDSVIVVILMEIVKATIVIKNKRQFKANGKFRRQNAKRKKDSKSNKGSKTNKGISKKNYKRSSCRQPPSDAESAKRQKRYNSVFQQNIRKKEIIIITLAKIA